jgi:hypothetical protein
MMACESNLFAEILACISSPSSVISPQNYPVLTGTDTERLRQDVERISKDFNVVIERENGKLKVR